MMRTIKGMLNTVFILVALVWSTGLLAKPLTVEEIEEYLELSGLGEALDSIPDALRQQMNLEQLVEGSEPEELAAIEESIQKALANADGREVAEVYLLSFDEGDSLREIMSFLKTPLGQEIVAAEAVSNEPTFDADMQQYIQGLADNPLPADRLQAIQGLTRSLDLESRMVEMVKGITFSGVSAVRAIAPNEEDFKAAEAEMLVMWENMEPGLRQQMGEYILMSSLFSYRDLSNEQIGKYAEVLSSEAGQVYVQSSMDIIEYYFQAIFEPLVNTLVESHGEQ